MELLLSCCYGHCCAPNKAHLILFQASPARVSRDIIVPWRTVLSASSVGAIQYALSDVYVKMIYIVSYPDSLYVPHPLEGALHPPRERVWERDYDLHATIIAGDIT